jgi:hypothetical protein
MVAIITDKLKKQLANTLLSEFDSATHKYYIGLGASEEWDSTDTPPTPTNAERTDRLLRYKLQSAKSVLDASLVVTRYNWSSGTIYQQFNDNSIGQATRYYVITDENKVYICIRQGKDTNGSAVTSTVQPTSTSATTLTELADGYVWKYLYTVTAQNATRFLTANYMPVQVVDSAAPADTTYGQYLVQQAAKPKQVLGYRVTNAGSGYTTPGTLNIGVVGNGTGAHARAVITSSNTIGAIEVDESAGGFPFGTGYDYANVTITGGGGAGATAVPVFGPAGGVGKDATVTLRAKAINFNILADGNEEGVFTTGNDFRQLCLLRDITQYDSVALFTNLRGLALKQMALSAADDFVADQVITGGTTSAKAIIDFYDDSNTIWYHQTEVTGFTPFQDGEVVTTTTATANRTADSAAKNPDFDPFSGDLLYIDNRNLSVTRSIDQTEDVKVIIQL